MTRVVLLATHGSRLDRSVELIGRSAATVLAEAQVCVSNSRATSDAVMEAVGQRACTTHVLLVDALELVETAPQLGEMRTQLAARGGTLELHGLVLPFLDQALEMWSGNVAAGRTSVDFTSWLALECQIAWPRLLPAVEIHGGGLWPVEASTSPAMCLLRLLDLPPLLAAQVRAIADDVMPRLTRQLMAWELELCRIWNTQGRTPVGRVLGQMSPTGPPYMPTEEDASVVLARFGAAVEVLNAGRLRGGARAQLATPQMLSLISRVPRPVREQVATPPTLKALDEGDRMNRAVLALLLSGGSQ